MFRPDYPRYQMKPDIYHGGLSHQVTRVQVFFFYPFSYPFFYPKRCFSSGTPYLVNAKSSIHLPVIENLEVSAPLIDSFSPKSWPPTTSSEWVLSSHLWHSIQAPISFSLERATILSSQPNSFPFFAPPKVAVLYKTQTWACLSTS